jgi:hypothetical protein
LERLRLTPKRGAADEIAFTGVQAAADKGFTDTAQNAYTSSFGAARGDLRAGFGTATADANRGFDTALTDTNRGFDEAQVAAELGYTTAQGDYEKAYQRQGEFQQPFIDDGALARDQIMQLMGLRGDTNAANYGEYAKAFGTDQFEQDPGYAFRHVRRPKGARAISICARRRIVWKRAKEYSAVWSRLSQPRI